MKPVVSIAHSLPGRVRVRLSHALKAPGRVRASVLDHIGLRQCDYTPLTRSLLVRFDPHLVSPDEIVLRVAMNLSMEHGMSAVRLLQNDARPALAGSAVYSGIALAVAYLTRAVSPQSQEGGPLSWLAAGTTAWAVVDHAVGELKKRGYFDPEVLSLAYLLTSSIHGNLLRPAAVTWFMAFGRHLLEPQGAGVEVQAVRRGGDGAREPAYEVIVRHDVDAPNQTRLVLALHGLIKIATTGQGVARRNLLEELKVVSGVHGRVLEGFGRMRRGIPLRFE